MRPWLFLLALGACSGGDAPAVAPELPPPKGPLSSGTALERFFPLVDGHLYHYAVQEADGGGRLLVRVERADGAHGTWRLPSATRHFRYAEDGIVRLSDLGAPMAYVLKAPLELGRTWPGEHGGVVRIAAVDAAVDVPAGHFTGCVQTIEERKGDQPAMFATTFCPETGVVLLDASSGEASERAELVGFGPPVDLGPDGVRRMQDEPSGAAQ